MTEPIDLGLGHILRFTKWAPDRALNPQYDGVPDIDPVGATIEHGNGCGGSLLFDLPGVRTLFPNRPVWNVESMNPLTISPSVLCMCGDHGYVRDGKWVPS